MIVFWSLTTGVLLIALLAVEGRPGPARGWVKGAASSAFVATAISAGAGDTGYGRWVLAALALSLIGDLALVSRARMWFLVGLGSFLTAHLAYMIGFVVRGVDWIWIAAAAVAVTIPALIVLRWLRPHVLGEMRLPVAAYVVVISAMGAAAVGTAAASWEWLIPTAAAAFYLSDISVARDRFVAPGMGNRLWGLPLYYLAQVLFALSV